jgi:hypothetical protein
MGTCLHRCDNRSTEVFRIGYIHPYTIHSRCCMNIFFRHRRHTLAASLCAAALSLFVFSGMQAQTNVFPWPQNGLVGIGTITPTAFLELHGNNLLPLKPSLLLTHEITYAGELGISLSGGLSMSKIATPGDVVLRALGSTTRPNSKNLILTAQSADGQIQFGTTVAIGSTLIEREAVSFRSVQDATSQMGHTQVDIKTAAPQDGNAVLRFYNSPVPGGSAPWMMGMDSHHYLHVTHQLPPLPVFRIGLNQNVASPTFSENFNFLTILRDGRVIIGKPINPSSSNFSLFDSKLSVDGRIVANELVCVDISTWADFVFDESYHLPSLMELEQHIQEHKHLPDIPSAADVKRDGVNVVEMQAKLLQKVEELTLYVIDQNKKISEQNGRIEQLEAELSAAKCQGEQP